MSETTADVGAGGEAPERFCWEEEVGAPETGAAGHIDNIQIAQLMYDAWQHYMLQGVGLSSDVYNRVGRPTVREISARFDREIFPGDRLVCGVRALRRSNRSFTLRQVLRREEDGATVASGTVVLVTIDPATYTPVAVPEELWLAIEAAEGRSIPAGAP